MSDNVRALASLLNTNDISHYLKATNFGFTIPTGATITGILVEIEKRDATGASITDNAVRVVKGGVIGSTDKSIVGVWPGSDTYISYGSSSDLWGETWTYSDINNANFGVVLSAKLTGLFAVQAAVDHIRITVYYTQ